MKLRLVAALTLLFAGCAASPDRPDFTMNVTPFGTTSSGEEVSLYTLSNGNMTAAITDYGATLVNLMVPDKHGALADVVLGFDDVSGYEGDGNQYFGCTVGRVANRIAGASFTLNDTSYELAKNDGEHHLHGGLRGWDKQVWKVREAPGSDAARLVFSIESPAGAEGYPGNVTAQVTYALTKDDELRIDYEATTDAATPLVLTHHSYFNLSGEGAATVLDHELRVVAQNYTPTDDSLIPTGEIAPVAGTPVDFRSLRRVGHDIALVESSAALGYDHNFVLDGEPGELRLAAELRDPSSGRHMELWTTEPGLQFYTGNHLFGQTGKGRSIYNQRSALCLEAQHFPDSINQASFPSVVLEPGETYRQTTVHRFTTD